MPKKATFALIAKCRRLNLPCDIQLDLFDKTIVPILLYGCEVWGISNIERVEIFYRKFLKRTLKTNFSTINCKVYAETGRRPLKCTIQKRIIKFWLSLVFSEKCKLSSLLFKFAQAALVNGIALPWLSSVKAILDETGFSFLWNDWNKYDRNWICNQVCLRIADQASQCLLSEIQTNNRSTYYSGMRILDINQAQYLSITTFPTAVSIAKIRLGTLRVPENLCRFDANSVLVCPLCLDHCSPDEYHYILICPVLQNMRQDMLHPYYCLEPNLYKFYKLLNSDTPLVLNRLAHFSNKISRLFC